MSDKNPFYNNLTKPIRDVIIDNILSRLSHNDIFPSDIKFNFEERISPKIKLLKHWEKWIDGAISGIDGFRYKNIANGNTDSLNQVVLNLKPSAICAYANDYSYYKFLADKVGIPFKNLNEVDTSDVLENDLICVSIPNAYNGNIQERNRVLTELQKINSFIYIDIAYLGTCYPQNIQILNTPRTMVAFSFSKTLSLSFNRISTLYSNIEIPTLEIMNKVGYYNIHGINSAMTLIQNLKYDYIFESYHDQYPDICKRLNLTQTECVLFGHDSEGNKFGVSEYYNVGR